MSIINTSGPGLTLAPEIAPEIAQKLRGVRVWSLTLGLAAVVAAATGVLLIGMILAMLIDWWTLPENGVLRPWLTGTPIVASLGVLIAGIRLLLARQSVLWRAATEVDRTHPELDQRWTTLARAEGGNHPAMHRKLTNESVAWVPRVAPSRVAPKTRLWHAAWILAPALAMLFTFMMIDTQRAGVLLSRFVAPGSNITLTRLVDLPERLVVARGESLQLKTRIEGRIPDEAHLEIRKPNGKTRRIALDFTASEANVVGHTIRQVDQPIELRWIAGDGRSDWLPVVVADRPKIASTRLRITPPTYTKQKITNLDRLPKRQRVIEGSLIELSFKPAETVETCSLAVKGGGADSIVNLKPVDDGWYVWSYEAVDDTSIEISLTESHGLSLRKPTKGRFLVYQDRAPSVEVISPDNEMAVQPDEEIEIEFVAKDDFAITHADLVVYGESEEGEATILQTVSIDLGDQRNAKKVKGSVPLDLSNFVLEDGQAISYAVRVYDNRETPAASPSPNAVAAVMSADHQAIPAPSADSQTAVEFESEESDSRAASAKSDESANQTAGDPTPIPAEPEIEAVVSAPSPAASLKADSPSSATPAASSLANEKTPPKPSDAASTATSTPEKDSSSLQVSTKSPPKTDSSPPQKTTTDSDPSVTKPVKKNSLAADIDSGKEGAPGSLSPSSDTPKPAYSLAQADKPRDKPEGKSEESPSNPAKVADRDKESDTAKPAEGLAESNDKAVPNKVSEKASATSDKQRLIAGKEESEEEQATAAEELAEDQRADKPANEGTPADSRFQPQPSRDGKSSDVAVPEGMITQAQDPSEKQSGESPEAGGGTPPPGDEMTRRLLDTPQSQSTASTRMRLKVDEWAGSFDGQRRDKLAIAISPVLAKLDANLASAEKMTGAVADRLEEGQPWQSEQRRTVSRADGLLEDCEEAVTQLAKKTAGTPYAFVGLELGTIIHTHMPPARESLWEAKETPVGRAEEVRLAWGEIAQARMRLTKLTKSFERIHREHRLAEAADKIKKMYQVFIEDSLLLLQPDDGRINNYQRRMAELELDDEYLKRYEEVLKMQQEMRAELARLLTDDPRLMRRYLDRLTARNTNLRDQATLLAERQQAIATEARVWKEADEAKRPALLEAILAERLSRLTEIAELATLHNERLAAWAPLEDALDAPALASVGELAKRAASDSLKLAAMPPTEGRRLAEGRKLYATLGELDAAIRRVEVDSEASKLATHLLNRLAEVRELTLLTSSWIRQTDLLQKGEYWREAAVEQYKLAMKTDKLAGKLAGLEQELTRALPDGSEARDGVASQAEELLRTFDEEVSANQLAATFAMRRGREQASVTKSAAANDAFQKVERLFDELMRATLDELDKQPVQDPIAQLLDDPTLDELLALLENETPLQELLGLPARPTNLRIIGDWMSPNSSGGGDGGMVTMQIQQQAQRAKDQAQQAYRRALLRAKKGERDARSKKRRQVVRGKRTEWNTLLSSLRDDLLQGEGRLPPEEYRRAIEYYLARISRLESEPEND